jgi:predicted lipoprotein with Yx(FWY)xxD motif
VTVASTRFGRIVMTGKNFALYSFSADSRGRSNCSGACARAWPPLLTKGTPVARGAASGPLLGTTRRRDGSLQVTYRGHPLYLYVGDTRPGEVLCQGVEEYGGLWTVVSPRGRAIH